jgi:small G protein signaling modulator 3
MSPSSSSDSIPYINISSPITPSKPTDSTALHRTNSAPPEQSPSLDQMRTEAIRTITTLRSPARLRATTLTETRSRSGSDSTVPKPLVLSQSSSSTSLTSLGQRSPVPIVELDTIVPAGIQPPSVSARWDDHYKPEESGLTDRYGFIVAAGHRGKTRDVLDLRESLRERTRSYEEKWANVASETEDRIEELRKLGAKETRIPSPFIEGWNTPIKEDTITQASVVMTDMRSHSPTEVKVTSPLINEIVPPETNEDSTTSSPEPTFSVRDPTPLTPSLSVATPLIPTLSNPSDLSTIKLLLSKLNDLHDSLDRANKQRWDKWLSQSDPTDSLLTPPPGTKGHKQRLKDFKLLVMGGIPVKYRSKIWAECSGATELSRPGYFEELCSLGVSGLDTLSVQQIEMDIHRTMPNNVFFGGNGPGITKLEKVLITFSRHNPSIGYCQGSNDPSRYSVNCSECYYCDFATCSFYG